MSYSPRVQSRRREMAIVRRRRVEEEENNNISMNNNNASSFASFHSTENGTGVFLQTCQEQLSSSSSNTKSTTAPTPQPGVSQAVYASFVSRYCRHSDDTSNSNATSNTISISRGPACSEAMLLFQDLPLPVQIAFVQHMTNFTCSVLVTAAVSATTGKDATTASAAAAAAAIPNDDDRLLPLCLEELHAGGELFYVSDPTAIPSLCETTWETMISTQLLEVLENNSTNNNATVAEDTVWTPPMAAAPGGPSQQQQQTRSHLTAVLGLGIGMTVVFLLAIVVKLKTTTRHYKSNRTNDKSPPSPTEGLGVDVINIRGDESFSSENSEPAAAAPSEETPDTASPHGTGGNSCTHGAPLPTTTTSDFSISSSSFGPNPYRPENQFLSDRSNELLRNPSSLSSIKHHCGMLQRFPNPPPLVVTERLSDDNPVHQRKRFPRSNSSSSRVFTFEERDIAKKRPSVVEILRVPSADDSRMNFQQDGTLQSVSLLDKENDENVKPVPQRNRSIFQLDTKTTLFEETISNNAGEPLQGSGGGSRV